jgi:hypothetical protein
MIFLHPPKHDSVGDETKLSQGFLSCFWIMVLGNCGYVSDCQSYLRVQLTRIKNFLVENGDMAQSPVMNSSQQSAVQLYT